MKNTPDESGQIKALKKTFEIVETINELGEATLAEIASEVDSSKSTLYRHLLTLQQRDFVVRTGDTYRLGYRFLEYGISTRNRDPIYAVAEDSVKTLADDTDERVWCVIKEGNMGVYIDKVEGKYKIHTDIAVGERRPLHSYAAGKAILAFQPEDEIERILDEVELTQQTEHTTTDRDQLLAELEDIRDRGYAFNREESIKGLHAVGAPIRNDDDEVHAALSIAGAANRMSGNRFTRDIPEMLLGAVNDIELALRHP